MLMKREKRSVLNPTMLWILKYNCKKEKTLYGNGGASERIVKILKKIKTDNLFQKKFYNIK